MYCVKGYRITKIKGVLMLKRWDTNKNDEDGKKKKKGNSKSLHTCEGG